MPSHIFVQLGMWDDVVASNIVADRNTAPNIHNGYTSMKTRQVVESEHWEKLALPTNTIKNNGTPSYNNSTTYVFAAGFSAAHLGDLATANAALEKLKAMRMQT